MQMAWSWLESRIVSSAKAEKLRSLMAFRMWPIILSTTCSVRCSSSVEVSWDLIMALVDDSDF